jgi:hypothetical protein
MPSERAYGSPRSFRQALTDRLKTLAAQGPWGLPELQRQIAYDRLLTRLYLVDRGWIVKGATALLARELGVRATTDIDLYRGTTIAVAERELREAADADIGDWFAFELGASRPIRDGLDASRVPIEALIGPTVWVSFHVDLVGAQVKMTGEPDEVPALARVDMPDVEQSGYRAYPLVDHITDKIVATFGSYGSSGGPSTRYKDLIDLVAIARGASVEASAQLSAPRSKGAASCSLDDSTSPTASSGHGAMPRKRGAHSSIRPRRSRKPWRSWRPSSILSSTAARKDSGIPREPPGSKPQSCP